MQPVTDNTPRGFLRVEDVQRRLGIGRNSAYILVNSKGFPRIHVGSRIIIPADLFERWIDQQAECPKGAMRHG